MQLTSDSATRQLASACISRAGVRLIPNAPARPVSCRKAPCFRNQVPHFVAASHVHCSAAIAGPLMPLLPLLLLSLRLPTLGLQICTAHTRCMQVFHPCTPGVAIAQAGYASIPARNNTCIQSAAFAQAWYASQTARKNTCIPGVVIAQMGYASFPARNNTCIHGAAIAQAVQPSLPPRSKACIHGTSGVCKSSGAEQYLHTRRCNCMGGVCQFSDNLPARPIKFAGA